MQFPEPTGGFIIKFLITIVHVAVTDGLTFESFWCVYVITLNYASFRLPLYFNWALGSAGMLLNIDL